MSACTFTQTFTARLPSMSRDGKVILPTSRTTGVACDMHTNMVTPVRGAVSPHPPYTRHLGHTVLYTHICKLHHMWTQCKDNWMVLVTIEWPIQGLMQMLAWENRPIPMFIQLICWYCGQERAPLPKTFWNIFTSVKSFLHELLQICWQFTSTYTYQFL